MGDAPPVDAVGDVSQAADVDFDQWGEGQAAGEEAGVLGVDGDEDRACEQVDEVGDVRRQHGVWVALVFAGAGAEAGDADAFPGTQWPFPRDVLEHGTHDRVPVLHRTATRTPQAVDEPDDAVAGAHHTEAVGLLSEPGLGESGARRSFETFDDRADLVMVVGVGLDDRGGAPSAGASKNVVATCDAGTSLLGTGFKLDGAGGRAFLRWSVPDFNLTTNTVIANAANGFGGSWEATSYAICATPPGATTRFGQTSGSDPTNSKSATTNDCPGNTRTTGVGGAASTGPAIGGFVFVNQISTNLAQHNATAEAAEALDPGVGVTWDLDVINICWAP